MSRKGKHVKHWVAVGVIAVLATGLSLASGVRHVDAVRTPGLPAGWTADNLVSGQDDVGVDRPRDGGPAELVIVKREDSPITRLQTALGKHPADLSALPAPARNGPLQWIQASCGGQLRFIGINDVQCFHAEAKYTCVVTATFEAHIRTPLKDLLGQLDPAKFWPISRSAIVNVGAIDSVQRIDGVLSVRLTNSVRWLPVSQAYQHQFRQM